MRTMKQQRDRRGCVKTRETGGAMVEVALMAPWIFLLFIAVFDFGFYAYAAICTQNAARAAAIRTAADGMQDFNEACNAALAELALLPNTTGLTSPGGCQALPVVVQMATLTNSTTPICADCTERPTATSSQVSVTYQSIPLIPIPGVMTGRLNMTRVAEARILNE
jgi:Flp pilus assembly protein TadG